VSYLQINLLDREGTSLFGDLDIILCRNVLMYFPAPLRLQAIQVFFRKLAPRGYLLLGHSENLLGLDTPFEAQRLLGSLVYRKPTRPPVGLGEEWGG
jgi:chemotaxis protein methyltransferase CheR